MSKPKIIPIRDVVKLIKSNANDLLDTSNNRDEDYNQGITMLRDRLLRLLLKTDRR